jgi:hypothetical protein
MATRYNPKIVTDGLILALDAANTRSYPGSGTTWFDISGNNRDFTINNPANVPHVSDNGGAFDFAGTTGYIEDADGESYINGLSALTLEVWVKSDVTSTDKGVFIAKTPDGGDTTVSLRYDVVGVDGGASNTIKFAAGPSTATGTNSEASANSQTTDWQCLNMTWSTSVNSGFPKLYINGKEDVPSDNDAETNAVSGATRVLIGVGCKETVGSSSWNGKIATVKLYNKTFSDAEVLQNYNALKGRFGL